MNVLWIIHYPVFGGPHNQAMLVSRSLERHGVNTTVLLPADERGSAVARLRGEGVDVVQIPLHRMRATWNPVAQMRFLRALLPETQAIRDIIRARQIDVVQVGGLVNPHGAIAGHLEQVPVVWQLLDTRAPIGLRRLMMPLVVRLADGVMTTGMAVARAHPGTQGLGSRLAVFFPPVDVERFTSDPIDRTVARRNFGFEPDDLVAGVVGNLNPQKGHEYLLQAASLCRNEGANVRLLIVGATHDTHVAYERSLHKLTRELGLVVGKDVVFAGALNDVRPALAAMDLFVMASVPRSEGAPTAIEEAMMMKLPVVATDVGAVRELVDDGRTGFVVPPRDARRLSAAMLRLFSDARLLNEFGLRGRERAAACYSAEECARVHLEAYELAVTRHNGRQA
jgi:glycosyltransferase involved in cell wall biosynthesis